MKSFRRFLKFIILTVVVGAVCLTSAACGWLFPSDNGDDPDDTAPSVILLRISVATPAQKLVYIAGESFEPEGMSVMAHYSNGTKQKINDYIFSPAGALTVRDGEIIIAYREKFVKQKITVTLGLSYKAFINKEYDFSGLKKTAYEAEDALVPGRILSGDRKNYPDTTKLNGASGDAWLGNTGFSNNWIEFSVVSSTETDAVFELILACSFFWVFEPVYGGNIPMEKLSRFIDMTIFGCPVDLSDIRLKPGFYDKEDSLNTAWTNWTSLIIEGVHLMEGVNVLRIDVKPLFDEYGENLKDPIWNYQVYRCPSLDVLNVWTK